MQDPRYRLPIGRRPRDRELDPGKASRMIQVRLPLDLFEDVWNDIHEADIAQAISGLQPAYASDYIRASILLFHRLLSGASRARVLSFTNLPEQRLPAVLAHLEFVYATLPGDPEKEPHVLTEKPHPGIDPTLHAEMYRRAEGIEDKPVAGKAPLKEKDPWNRL